MTYGSYIVKRKRSKKAIFIVVCSVLAFVVLSIIYFEKITNPIIYDVAQAQIKSKVSVAVNNAVRNVAENSSYADLMIIERDDQNNITMLVADTQKINLLYRDIVAAVQQELVYEGAEGINIPIGTLTGVPILSGKGIDVKLKLLPIGNANGNFRSEFSSSGINQTNHKIFVSITTEMSLFIGGEKNIFQNNSDALISESIILGKIPQVYLNSISQPLNLVP